MKRICIILLCAALLCSLAGCDGITININLNGAETTAPKETTAPSAGQDTTEPEKSDPATVTTEPPEVTSVPGETSDGSEATFADLYDTWHRLVGYWITNSEVYAVLDMADSHTAVFHYGWWESEFDSGEQIVQELTASGEEEMTATLADGSIVVIDYSGLERDGKIRIKIGDQEWLQCANGGGSTEEAYQTYCNNREGA